MNYLLTLAQRTLGADLAIRPVLPTAFEPARRPSLNGLEAEPVDRARPLPADQPRASAPAGPSQAPHRVEPLPGERESAPDHPPRAAAAPAARRLATDAPDVATPGRPATSQPEHPSAPVHVVVSPGTEPARIVLRPAAVARLPVDRPVPGAGEGSAPAIFPRREADPRAGSEPLGRQVSSQPAAELPDDPVAPPQTIHVHIGRVEVRATPPAVQAARPAPVPPAARRTALEAYLAGQSGGAS